MDDDDDDDDVEENKEDEEDENDIINNITYKIHNNFESTLLSVILYKFSEIS